MAEQEVHGDVGKDPHEELEVVDEDCECRNGLRLRVSEWVKAPAAAPTSS